MNTVGSLNNQNLLTNTVDWVYVGDSSTGLCRGITPNDSSYGGFGTELGQIVPFDPTAVPAQLLTASIQTFLVLNQNSTKSAEGLKIGIDASLPVYDWGESAYARFSNVAPPNPQNDVALYVHDTRLYPDLTAATSTNTIPFYTSDGSTSQTVTFDLSDVDATSGTILKTDNGSVQPRLITTPPDGFIADTTGTPTNPPFTSDTTTNLVANNGSRYLGTYTYTIGDGTGRNNTPGARRRFQNVRQVVTEYDYDGTTYTKKGTVIIGGDATAENLASIYDPVAKKYTFTNNSKIAAVDQPTFGILNPLAVRGGGVPLLAPGTAPAVAIGDEAGPFRSVNTQANGLPTLSTYLTANPGDFFALQALTNGNDVLKYAPPSSSGVTGDPTKLLDPATNPLAPAPTATAVVVTATGLIAHNTVGDNSEPISSATGAPVGGPSTTTDGLPPGANFGGFGLDAFDRSALVSLSQTLRLKMTVPSNVQFAPQSGRDGLYWNSNVPNDLSGHESVVNYLPWETPPMPYSIGINTSQDYPDIAPGNIAQNAISSLNNASPGDLTSNSVTLPQGALAGGTGTLDARVKARTVTGDPVQIKVTVPHYQPANQQLYQEAANQPYNNSLPGSTGTKTYNSLGQIEPLNLAGNTSNISTSDNVFPMGYVTSKRLYVPSGSGFYSQQRPYRDIRVYTGVPVDMRTSIANATTDIGKVPAAFGVQTEDYPTRAWKSVHAVQHGVPGELQAAGSP